MTHTDPWNCPTCHTTVSTPYCPECGERPLRPRELTFRGLFDQLVRAFTAVDGRLIRSFRYLVGRPGFLTVAYLQGQRKPYVGPVPLFLIANALFFATESLTGGKVFTTPLDAHLHTQPWSHAAELLVSHRLAAKQTTLDLYAPVFDHAVAVNARSLIVFMALSFVAALAIVFPGAGARLWPTRCSRSTCTRSCCCSSASRRRSRPLTGGSAAPGSPRKGWTMSISILLLLACAVYLYIATGQGLRRNRRRPRGQGRAAHRGRGGHRAGLPIRPVRDHVVHNVMPGF